MRGSLWVAVAIAAAVCVAAGVWSCWSYLEVGESEWTTRSPAALEELLAGLEDRSRHYYFDAVEHFERALELDGDFAAAKLFLAATLPHETSQHERLFEELRDAGAAGLTLREGFLVRHTLARHDGDEARAGELRRAFLAEHPEDPYALREECAGLWRAQDWGAAEDCYLRLAMIDPDWLEAQNRLGYIALARGRFEDAEEHFIAYRYVAPDQAAPYESLALLYLLRGRYEEGDEALAEALRIKDDFCPAYLLRGRLESVRGEPGLALATLDELAAIPSCEVYEELGRLCPIRAWLKYQQGDTEGAWEQVAGTCLERQGGFDATAYRIAAMTGRADAMADMRRALQAKRDAVESLGQPVYASYFTAMESYVDGVDRLAKLDYAAAAEHFRRADASLGYWVGELAGFKLFNRLNLLRSLELAGEDDEALALRVEIEAINPRIVAEFRIPDFDGARAVRRPAGRRP